MEIKEPHKWNVTPKEAVEIQKKLKSKIDTAGTKKIERKIKFIAGADVAFPKGKETVKAAVCVLTFPGLEVIEEKTAYAEKTFPYVPGLLSFREGPALIECFKKVRNKPDVIIFDGHGIAHPRGIGIATHIGIVLGIPSIGCAKSPLYGKFDMPGESKGGYTFVRDGDGKVIGACFRSKDGVKPVFVSVGNGINLITAVDIINDCITKYRLPEPVRIADALSKSENS